jgi:hypothetical protein
MGMFGWDYPAGCSSTPYDEFTPETCPICGKDNWDEKKEEWVHKSQVFCSDACEEEDSKNNKEAADALAKSFEEEIRIDKDLWRKIGI